LILPQYFRMAMFVGAMAVKVIILQSKQTIKIGFSAFFLRVKQKYYSRISRRLGDTGGALVH
jgi:hypothetical protein